MQKISKFSIFISLLSFGLFGITAYLTNYMGICNNFDQNAIDFFYNIAAKHNLILANIITDFGYVYVISALLVIISIILAVYKKYKEMLLLNMVTFTSVLANSFFKDLFQRMRPPLEYHLTPADSYAFPSGHALVGICFYGILIYISHCLIKNKKIKTVITYSLSILIFLIGLSRVYLGVHFPTDVIAGFFLGLSIIFFWVYIVCYVKLKKNQVVDKN